MKHLKKINIIIIFLTLLYTPDYSQAQEDKIFRIAHVISISSIEDIDDKGFLDKISNWILGDDRINLNKPVDVIAKNSKDIIVLDQGLASVVEINRDNKSMKLYDSDSLFPSLISICKFIGNDYLFTDSKNNKIYVLDQKENINNLYISYDLNKPTGIAFVKSTKEIWISETGTHSIVILDSMGNFVKRIGKRGTKESEFNFPTSLWVDKNELIYVVDAINFRIQIFDKHGNFIKMFGEQGDATGYFARPKGVATDSYGNIYVVDGLFHNVQIFNDEGKYLYNFGSQGTDDGKLWLPTGIYIDDENYIYLADSYNSRIQIFKLIQN